MSAPAGHGRPVPPRPSMLPTLSAGGYSRPLAGFAECGDAFVVCGVEPGAGGALLVAVVDGLGHGKEAAVAALAATRTVVERRDLPVDEILRHCDRELQPTRGAAMGVLRIEQDGSGAFCGVGNIEVQILAGQPPGLFCLPGIVGHRLRTVRILPFVMQAGDIYCLHSDGVSGRGDLRACLPGAPEAVARCIVDRWGRRHDDATAVVLGYGAGAKLPAAAAAPGPGPGGSGGAERIEPDTGHRSTDG
jgi:negative regulator of sigma-B (phosphoserine phosphatase)